MAATSPAGGAAPRLRSVDSSSGDMGMAGVPRAELKEHKDSHQTRSRAVGSLAHVAATALKRKNAVVAAGRSPRSPRRASPRSRLFHSDVVGTATLYLRPRVAVLLAGSRAFNRTTVRPRRCKRYAASHPVDAFFSTQPLADELGVGTERACRRSCGAPRRGIHDHRRRRHSTSAEMRAAGGNDSTRKTAARWWKTIAERRKATLDDDESFGDDVSDDHSANDSAFGESGDVIAEYLPRRARRGRVARKQTAALEILKFAAWIVARIPRRHADDCPCAKVSCGRCKSAPGPRGGVNDRFAGGGRHPRWRRARGYYACPGRARRAAGRQRDGAPLQIDTGGGARTFPTFRGFRAARRGTARSVCHVAQCRRHVAWTPSLVPVRAVRDPGGSQQKAG